LASSLIRTLDGTINLIQLGKLIIIDSNGRHEYLINTRLADHVIDDITSKILKDFPQDAVVDFEQLY